MARTRPKKESHEIRDPVHTFVRLDSDERRVLDSRPVQRLRHVHQLAMTHLVYPGASHKRFEHSLGVMEVATRIFDVVTEDDDLHEGVRRTVPRRQDELSYWRKALRMAALCHDLGHLPFSHAAEDELLPEGWDHERITIKLIRSAEMEKLWSSLTPPLRPEDVAKLAVGRKRVAALPSEELGEFGDWETILSEIIVGDVFGADRIDYLLRDSLHAGVAYGRFDHHRLIDTLRILPQDVDGSREPALGVEEGGLQSAEALLLARYFMYSQVYFHPVRRIYDHHLKEFLRSWLEDGTFPVDVERHLALTDHEVYAELLRAASESSHSGHGPARRLVERNHYREVYRRNARDIEHNPNTPDLLAEALKGRFGAPAVVYDAYRGGGDPGDFPVDMPDGRIASALVQSEALRIIPPVAVNYVFVDPGVRDEAEECIGAERERIVTETVRSEEETDGET